jgi:hypothetical protein
MSRNARFTMIVVAALAAGWMAVGCGDQPKPTGGPYVNTDWGFSITLPPGWGKEEELPGSIVETYPPDQAGNDTRLDYLIVSGEQLKDALTLDEYAQIKSSNGAKVMPNYKELERATVDLNGTKAVRVVYTAHDESKDVTSVAWFILGEGRGFMIIGMAKTDSFKTREPSYDQIAKTFKLEKAAAPAK